MEQGTIFITNNLPYIILVILGLLVVSLIFFININIKLARMNKRYKKLMTGMDGCNIERILMGHIDEVRDVVKNIEMLEQENKRLDLITKKSVQRMAIIRFSAFEEIGSDLSYAIALLDQQNNGFVITNLFGREESRSYAKPIINGESTYMLTEEEKQVLAEAMKK